MKASISEWDGFHWVWVGSGPVDEETYDIECAAVLSDDPDECSDIYDVIASEIASGPSLDWQGAFEMKFGDAKYRICLEDDDEKDSD